MRRSARRALMRHWMRVAMWLWLAFATWAVAALGVVVAWRMFLHP
ncbi:MAG TPA: hypothetical protein VEI03_08780 [Stellaceae bacterium]|nr:hypothetical protein [Stellaceae bacterium]